MTDYTDLIARLREKYTTELEQEAADELEAQARRIAELEKSLSRMLLEFDFMVEGKLIADVRNDVIFERARAALGEKE